MNILCIGNSYSEDATAYLSRIAEEDGVTVNTVNLFIGGCSLFTHFKNMHSEERAYFTMVNGVNTNFKTSIKEALLSRQWDVVTLQQASTFSFDYGTYQPYLNELAAYVRKYAPKAKVAIHETWAYKEGSERLIDGVGFEKQIDMHNALHAAYQQAAKDINADFILPSGTLLQELIKNGITNTHRDAVHVSLGVGRYAFALLWYKVLTGNSVLNNTFDSFKGAITDEEIAIAKKCVEELQL